MNISSRDIAKAGHARQLAKLPRVATPTRMEFTVPVPPSANRYWTVVHNRIIVTAEARAYKQTVAAMLAAHELVPMVGRIEATYRVYRPNPKGDLDNYFKVVNDAMKGIAFSDDALIVCIHAYRHDDPANPRVEVEIRLVDGAQVALFGGAA